MEWIAIRLCRLTKDNHNRLFIVLHISIAYIPPGRILMSRPSWIVMAQTLIHPGIPKYRKTISNSKALKNIPLNKLICLRIFIQTIIQIKPLINKITSTTTFKTLNLSTTTISSKRKIKPWKNFAKNSISKPPKSPTSSPLSPTNSPSANTPNSSSPPVPIFITKIMHN